MQSGNSNIWLGYSTLYGMDNLLAEKTEGGASKVKTNWRKRHLHVTDTDEFPAIHLIYSEYKSMLLLK